MPKTKKSKFSTTRSEIDRKQETIEFSNEGISPIDAELD